MGKRAVREASLSTVSEALGHSAAATASPVGLPPPSCAGSGAAAPSFAARGRRAEAQPPAQLSAAEAMSGRATRKCVASRRGATRWHGSCASRTRAEAWRALSLRRRDAETALGGEHAEAAPPAPAARGRSRAQRQVVAAGGDPSVAAALPRERAPRHGIPPPLPQRPIHAPPLDADAPAAGEADAEDDEVLTDAPQQPQVAPLPAALPLPQHFDTMIETLIAAEHALALLRMRSATPTVDVLCECAPGIARCFGGIAVSQRQP
jgi:hypothetical protein